MFGSQILDVAMGMVFVFALLSLIASAAREAIETVLKARAKDLERGIGELLSDAGGTGARAWLYDHPTIAGLYRGTLSEAQSFAATWFKAGSRLPTYIPSRHFAEAILDIAARGPSTVAATSAGPVTMAAVRAGILAHLKDNACLQRSLLVALDEAGNDLAKARTNVEAWFDGGMDRVSGWYKRRTQYWLLAIGFATAIGMNIDSVRIVNALSTNDTLRKAVVAQAEAAAKGPAATEPAAFDTVKHQVEALGLPVGWSLYTDKARAAACAAQSADAAAEVKCAAVRHDRFDASELAIWREAIADAVGHGLLGWIITAFAVSIGAPFWFDVLNKIMVIRSTVKPGEKSGDKAQKDPVRKTGETSR